MHGRLITILFCSLALLGCGTKVHVEEHSTIKLSSLPSLQIGSLTVHGSLPAEAVDDFKTILRNDLTAALSARGYVSTGSDPAVLACDLAIGPYNESTEEARKLAESGTRNIGMIKVSTVAGTGADDGSYKDLLSVELTLQITRSADRETVWKASTSALVDAELAASHSRAGPDRRTAMRKRLIDSVLPDVVNAIPSRR